MVPRIVTLGEKIIVGKHIRMTYLNNRTFELWKSFMQERKVIKNYRTTDLYSIQIYDNDFDFINFNLNSEFEKWAGIEVSDFGSIPSGMQSMTLKGGLYAVFVHKGLPGKGEETFKYIFSVWSPQSDFLIDNRPHFEILGVKYKHDDPDSEEEIWIPVKPKYQYPTQP
jgi:AraC family transcriptional regulator